MKRSFVYTSVPLLAFTSFIVFGLLTEVIMGTVNPGDLWISLSMLAAVLLVIGAILYFVISMLVAADRKLTHFKV